MTQHEEKENKEKKEIIEEMEEELEQIQDEEWEIQEEIVDERYCGNASDELEKTKELLAKIQADFDNFKKRTIRDRDDMIFFLKSDIFKKVLPRVDDIDRMIENTPEELQDNALFEWVLSLKKAFEKDLTAMWVKPFDSIWKEPNPDRHEVMTKIPWWKDWIIMQEFEKWYNLWDKVLRVAKVVVGSWE